MDDMTERAPSLADRLVAWLRRRPTHAIRPASYWPALGVLAAIPGITTLVAGGLALGEEQRTDALRRAGAARIAAATSARRIMASRSRAAPYFEVPTLTAQLGEIVALLPSDAMLHAIARDPNGVMRIEVDCPDPDALLAALRTRSSRLVWRSVAQSVVEGAGVRVTLEAGR